MFKDYKNAIMSLTLALSLFVMAAGTADAVFSFRGYTYNETNVTLNNTNVSIEIYTMGGQQGPPSLVGINYTSSNANGYFELAISGSSDDGSYMYKPVLKHFANNATTGTLDYIGQSLPQFPHDMISFLTQSSPMNFYMRRGGTIYINASGINQSSGTVDPVAFKYMIKDTRLGYPITENFNVEQLNVGPINVPSERNYSIMIFPNQSLPVSYNLNNLTSYNNSNATITFNTSIRPRWVFGYALLSDNSAGFENLNIIAYLMEPGDIIGKGRPMPSNMSAFRNIPGPGGSSFSDTYNATNGSYNITLPGSAQGAGANILLFATAKNGSSYYGAFKNITMNYSASDVQNFNFTLYPLLGNVENISVNNMGTQGLNAQNITTKQLPFQLLNGTQNLNNQFAHIEIEVNYSANSSAHFKWMVDVQPTSNGAFSIPAINANIRKINVFTQNFAPLKTSKNTTQLATWPVNITLTSFGNKKPDGNAFSGSTFIDMLLSKPECDVPVPASGCSLMPDPTTGQAEGQFNPFKTVLGGGKISLRIKNTVQRITVHYKNVDMLASGPPDALFDESASSSQSGSTIQEAWRFGSKGPEIYDEVLIGVPITTSGFSGIKIGKLYDENWNAIWDLSAGNTSADIPSDYSAFPSSWFTTTGPSCSTTDTSAACYIDSTNGILWLRIPHFSGVGPTILRTTTTSSSGGGSSGSTGGSGVTTSEPYANIAKAERYDQSLIANTPVTYTFKAPELGIYEIAVTGKENENDVAIRVEALKDTAKGAMIAAPGVVYKNLNIIAGTTKTKEAVIKFKVENSWLGSNDLAGSEVALMRWAEGKWNPLETAEKGKDNTYTIFEAKTPGFSSFAITGLKAVATAATPAIGITETPAKPGETAISTPTVAPTKKSIPGFEATVAVLVISLLAASLRKDRKRR